MNDQSSRRFDAVLIYLLLEGVSALLFGVVVTIYVVFYAQTVGLDTLQIVLFGTVFETTIFLFEIPTGIVADVYSRRLSVILGILLTGAAYVVEGLVPTFAVVLAAEIVTGIGATFLSGATEAWIADEVGADRVGAVYVRGAQVKQIAAIAGIVISVLLASIDLTIPFVVAGAIFLLLAIFLIAYMPEAGFTPTPRSERMTWRSLTSTLRDGARLIRLRPLLLFILGYTFIFAFHGEGFDHLWQKHILDDFTLPDDRFARSGGLVRRLQPRREPARSRLERDRPPPRRSARRADRGARPAGDHGAPTARHSDFQPDREASPPR